MNFTSQISTTKEQSERLLVLGLRKETADMCIDNMGNIYTYPITIIETIKNDWGLIPLWSLHRLIEMMPSTLQDLYKIDFSKRGVYYADFSDDSFYIIQSFANLNKTLYDNVIDCIEWLIKVDFFNKEYLKE